MTDQRHFPKQFLIPVAGIALGSIGAISNGSSFQELFVWIGGALVVLGILLIFMHAPAAKLERRATEYQQRYPDSTQFVGILRAQGREPLGLPKSNLVRKFLNVSLDDSEVTFRDASGRLDMSSPLRSVRAIDFDINEGVIGGAPKIRGGIEVTCDLGLVRMPIIHPGSACFRFYARAELTNLLRIVPPAVRGRRQARRVAKHPMTSGREESAKEYLTRRQSDPDWVRDRENHARERAERQRALDRAERPILDDLQTVDVSVELVWDIPTSSAARIEVVDILLAHLATKSYPRIIAEGMARALGYKGARQHWSKLMRLFGELDSSNGREGLAAAMSSIATKAEMADIISLVTDPSGGRDRIVFLTSLMEWGEEGRELVASLVNDPELGVGSFAPCRRSSCVWCRASPGAAVAHSLGVRMRPAAFSSVGRESFQFGRGNASRRPGHPGGSRRAPASSVTTRSRPDSAAGRLGAASIGAGL